MSLHLEKNKQHFRALRIQYCEQNSCGCERHAKSGWKLSRIPVAHLPMKLGWNRHLRATETFGADSDDVSVWEHAFACNSVNTYAKFFNPASSQMRIFVSLALETLKDWILFILSGFLQAIMCLMVLSLCFGFTVTKTTACTLFWSRC